MPGMKPRIPTTRKTAETTAATDWAGVRSRMLSTIFPGSSGRNIRSLVATRGSPSAVARALPVTGSRAPVVTATAVVVDAGARRPGAADGRRLGRGRGRRRLGRPRAGAAAVIRARRRDCDHRRRSRAAVVAGAAVLLDLIGAGGRARLVLDVGACRSGVTLDLRRA